MGNAGKLRKVRLSTTPSAEALADLCLGDIVYLDGLIYTAREGVYMRALEESANIPMELPQQSAANFHCSPAATINSDGTFTLGAVTATASFRFAKWLPEWLAKSGAKLVIGKGGMSSQDYKDYFVPNGAIYLSTVGYGTGALLGRGVKSVKEVTGMKSLVSRRQCGCLNARIWARLLSRVIARVILYSSGKMQKLLKIFTRSMREPVRQP